MNNYFYEIEVWKSKVTYFSDFNLSSRTTNCFIRSKIKTFYDFLSLKQEEMWAIPNFGKACYIEIKNIFDTQYIGFPKFKLWEKELSRSALSILPKRWTNQYLENDDCSLGTKLNLDKIMTSEYGWFFDEVFVKNCYEKPTNTILSNLKEMFLNCMPSYLEEIWNLLCESDEKCMYILNHLLAYDENFVKVSKNAIEELANIDYFKDRFDNLRLSERGIRLTFENLKNIFIKNKEC